MLETIHKTIHAILQPFKDVSSSCHVFRAQSSF
jgi:hypothetical protein